VGANLGIYALVASRIVGPSGHVIAFETSQQSFFSFLYHGADPGGNSLGKDPRVESEGEEVETQSLDNALGQASVERVDLIKKDVEGAEELVVRGANEIIASHKPAIIFEVNQEASARLGLSPRGAWDQLKSLGYKFFSVQSNGVHKANSRSLLGNIVAIYGSPEPQRIPTEIRLRVSISVVL
jgi:hypothetical protein